MISSKTKSVRTVICGAIFGVVLTLIFAGLLTATAHAQRAAKMDHCAAAQSN